jgi:hypothetical protein
MNIVDKVPYDDATLLTALGEVLGSWGVSDRLCCGVLRHLVHFLRKKIII